MMCASMLSVNQPQVLARALPNSSPDRGNAGNPAFADAAATCQWSWARSMSAEGISDHSEIRRPGCRNTRAHSANHQTRT
jgi:hypothetical protein